MLLLSLSLMQYSVWTESDVILQTETGPSASVLHSTLHLSDDLPFLMSTHIWGCYGY